MLVPLHIAQLVGYQFGFANVEFRNVTVVVAVAPIVNTRGVYKII